jgi:hypothetical protein
VRIKNNTTNFHKENSKSLRLHATKIKREPLQLPDHSKVKRQAARKQKP